MFPGRELFGIREINQWKNSLKELMVIFIDVENCSEELKNLVKTFEVSASGALTLADTAKLHALIGSNGTVWLKNFNGKSYIKIRGNEGSRPNLNLNYFI